MSDIPCFFLEPTETVRRSLRRYKSRHHDGSDDLKSCLAADGRGWHDAIAAIDEISHPIGDEIMSGEVGHPKDDPRWPKACPCGYAFEDRDNWHLNNDRVYRCAADGRLFTLSEAPPGAMFYAYWLDDVFNKGPDGHCLCLRTPGGDWHIDGPSYNDGVKGPGWTRTGTPPRVTASPSIIIGKDAQGQWKFHGWLRDGVLVQC